MCSSNESGFKNEIAAKMFAHFLINKIKKKRKKNTEPLHPK